MDLDKKMMFLQNMTHMALSHAASTPNVVTPSGGMSHEKMMDFVRKVTDSGIKHFASGGTTAGGLGGGISDFLGTQNGFQAQQANINAGTNSGQLDTAYQGAQNALGQQQGVASTLNNQLNTGAKTQDTLTSLLLNQAQGNGPSPAQAQLNQSTGQNIAQQAALAAGVRGAGANAGLIAAQNAQQGAQTQQQAIGQAATLKAQEQLAAQSNLQNLAGSQVNQGQAAVQGINNAQQNEQNILQNANTAANNANVSATSNYNNTNAAISTANQNAAASGISGIGGLLSSATSLASLFEKGGMVKLDKGGRVLTATARDKISPSDFALADGRYPIHDINHARNALARVAQNGTADEKRKVKAAVHKKYPSLAENKMAQGGEVAPMVRPPQMMAVGGMSVAPSQSFVGNWLTSNTDTRGPEIQQATLPINTQAVNPFGAATDVLNKKAAQDKKESPAPVNPEPVRADAQTQAAVPFTSTDTSMPWGTSVAPTSFSPMLAQGGLMKSGGKVKAGKGQEAEVPGDSLKNDKVPAMLSQGELVIDRDTMKDPGPMGQMARALAAHIQSRNKGKK